MTQSQMDGRSFEAVGVGQPVLIVTCPIFANELFKKYLTEEQYRRVLNAFGVWDFFQNNEVQGLSTGEVMEIGPKSPVGFYKLSAAADALVFETGGDVRKVRDRYTNFFESTVLPDPREALSCRIGGESSFSAFESKHQWLSTILIPDDFKSTALLMASQEGRKYLAREIAHNNGESVDELYQRFEDVARAERADATKKMQVVLPDTEEVRAEMHALWQKTLNKIRGEARRLINSQKGYI